MTNIPDASADTLAALEVARSLVRTGVPVFCCDLSGDGSPVLPVSWQNTRPSEREVGRWKPGRALCAVTGVGFDVLDVDPRNGGDASFDSLDAQLGEDGPEVLARVSTPSGGEHLYVPPLGIGSHNGIMPGIDLKGGKPDGKSRGFVFIPPTVRPGKAGPVGRYRHNIDVALRWSGDGSIGRISDVFRERMAARNGSGAGAGGSGRYEGLIDDLRSECLAAGNGEQRGALRAWVGEAQKLGWRKSRIKREAVAIALEMPSFNEADPWQDDARTRRYIGELFYPDGRVVPDSAGSEADFLKSLAGAEPLTSGLVRRASEVRERHVTWLWERFIAFGEMTLLDGEKGVAKSMVTDDVVARATRGRAMPGMEEAIAGPIRVLYFTDEGTLETVLRPRIRAAGADLDLVFYQGVPKPKPGKVAGAWDVALPEGAPLIGKMIREARADLAIFDPVTDLLGEGIRSHEDASVRRALRPLAIVLSETGCAGWAIRHMNKDIKADAKYRGSGSMAYQNRARVHLVAREIPTAIAGSVEGKYAIAMVDSNLTEKQDGALCYSIDQSDVELDKLGNMVGRVNWHSWENIDILSAGNRDPRTSDARIDAVEVLGEMLGRSGGEITREEASAVFRDVGVRNDRTRRKVMEELGAHYELRHDDRGALVGGVWTTAKRKVGRSR